MTAATYLAGLVREQLTEAQVVIDNHLTFSRAGKCWLCEETEPCTRRVEAQQLFTHYGRLPRRTPGLTFADASRWSPGGWFNPGTTSPDGNR